jgi:hypothetical protein
MIHAEPDAREVVRGTETRSEAEIKGMTLEEADSVTPRRVASVSVPLEHRAKRLQSRGDIF